MDDPRRVQQLCDIGCIAAGKRPISFTIVPRSAYGVFEFLGTLMKIQRQQITPSHYAYIPPGRSYATKPPILETGHKDPNLMTVVQNLGGQCFVHTWFQDGDYCLPEQATTTKCVFGLLAQLIATQTAATDLSITPVVRVLQYQVGRSQSERVNRSHYARKRASGDSLSNTLLFWRARP